MREEYYSRPSGRFVALWTKSANPASDLILSETASESPGCAGPADNAASANPAVRICARNAEIHRLLPRKRRVRCNMPLCRKRMRLRACRARLDSISIAPLLCAGIIGFRALKRAEVKRGSRVGLWGFGSSAHIAIQVAAALGMRRLRFDAGCKASAAGNGTGSDMGGRWGHDRRRKKWDTRFIFAPQSEIWSRQRLESLEMGGTLAIRRDSFVGIFRV